MVAAELGEVSVTREINTGVSGICDVEVFRVKPGECEGGGHAASMVGIGGFIDVLVHRADGVGKKVEAIRMETRGGDFEGFRDDLGHAGEQER